MKEGGAEITAKTQAVKDKRSGLVTALSAIGLVFGLLTLVTSSISLLGVGVFVESFRRFSIPPATFGYILSAVNILTYCLGFPAILLCLTAFIAAYAKRTSKTLPVCSLCVGLFAVGLPLLTHVWYGPTLDLVLRQAEKTRYMGGYRESREKEHSIRTPLMEVAEAGQTERARELLNEGSDPRARPTNTWSAFGLAVREGHIDIVRAFLEHEPTEADKTYLGRMVKLAAIHDRNDIVVLLLDHEAEIDVKSEERGWTPLMFATYYGNTEIASTLFERGADPNARNIFGWTVLTVAAREGRLEIVLELLDRGADIDAKNNEGMTPLMWAANDGRTEVVKELLSRGADVNTRSNAQQTAMKYAACQNHTDIVRLLAASGAKN